jgi:hypothetical protein
VLAPEAYGRDTVCLFPLPDLLRRVGDVDQSAEPC